MINRKIAAEVVYTAPAIEVFGLAMERACLTSSEYGEAGKPGKYNSDDDIEYTNPF